MAVRSFTDAPAVRKAVPLLIGIVGPSGSGKTFSAMRLAAGIQRVVGGDIHGIDTEAGRMLHYADTFAPLIRAQGGELRYVPFEAPFSSLDYLAAIEHCVTRGARIIVIDSMSHEHEGEGGVCDEHDKLVERAGDVGERRSWQLWAGPKAKRRKLISRVLQLGVHVLFCFRAQEKSRPPTDAEKQRGQKDLVQRGWMPITGAAFAYEMTARFLLRPGADGRPTFASEREGEAELIKRPEQFRELFARPNLQIDEALGASMARWASGTEAAASAPATSLIARYASASTLEDLAAIRTEVERDWRSLNKTDRDRVTAAAKEAQARIDAAKPAAQEPF